MKDLFGIFKYTLNNHKPKVPIMNQKLPLVNVHLRIISNLKDILKSVQILRIFVCNICIN